MSRIPGLARSEGTPVFLWRYVRPLAVLTIVTSFIGWVIHGEEGLKLVLLALGLALGSLVGLYLVGRFLLLLLVPVRTFVHGLRGV